MRSFLVVCVVFHSDHSLCQSTNLFLHRGNILVLDLLVHLLLLLIRTLHSDGVHTFHWTHLVVLLVTYQHLIVKGQRKNKLNKMQTLI